MTKKELKEIKESIDNFRSRISRIEWRHEKAKRYAWGGFFIVIALAIGLFGAYHLVDYFDSTMCHHDERVGRVFMQGDLKVKECIEKTEAVHALVEDENGTKSIVTDEQPSELSRIIIWEYAPEWNVFLPILLMMLAVLLGCVGLMIIDDV